MATTRIKDITVTATQAAQDDYIPMDGATNGTRKILASNLGGGGGADELSDLSDVAISSATDGQVLTYDGTTSKWKNAAGGSSVSPYTSTPAPLGTASPGNSDDYSRGDHVHAIPTPADIGAIAAPSSPSSGAFLVWDGSAWTAQTLSTWSGGSY